MFQHIAKFFTMDYSMGSQLDYDLTPIISPTLGRGKAHTSGIGDFHGLTGGVYKTRERIHGNVLTYRY